MNMKSNECNVITSPFHLYTYRRCVCARDFLLSLSLSRYIYICVCLQVYLSKFFFSFDTLFCLLLCLLLLTRLKNIIDILIKFVHHKSIAGEHNRMKNIHTHKVKEWKSKVSEHLIRLYFFYGRWAMEGGDRVSGECEMAGRRSVQTVRSGLHTFGIHS